MNHQPTAIFNIHRWCINATSKRQAIASAKKEIRKRALVILEFNCWQGYALHTIRDDHGPRLVENHSMPPTFWHYNFIGAKTKHLTAWQIQEVKRLIVRARKVGFGVGEGATVLPRRAATTPSRPKRVRGTSPNVHKAKS